MQRLIISAVFLIPAIADMLFMIPLLMGFFGITPPLWNIPYYPSAILLGVAVAIIEYVLLALSMIHYLAGRKAKLLHRVDTLLAEYQKPLTISIILSLSTFTVLFLPQAFPRMLAQSDFYMSSGMIFLLKLIIITILYWGRSIKPTKLMTGMSLILIAGVTGLLILAMVAIARELLPSHFLTFPLSDTRARYVINYDGDYWITYYEVRQECEGTSCHDELVKKGNTSISESPVDLAPYRDRAVRVTGSFELIHGPKNGRAKTLCIGRGFQKKCEASTGPGVWYASPLHLNSIQLDLAPLAPR